MVQDSPLETNCYHTSNEGYIYSSPCHSLLAADLIGALSIFLKKIRATRDTTATEKEWVSLSRSSSPSKTTVASQSKTTIAKNSEEKLKEQKSLCALL